MGYVYERLAGYLAKFPELEPTDIKLVWRYGFQNRKYHNTEHLVNILDCCHRMEIPLTVDVVRVAILHDAIMATDNDFDPVKGNEVEQSAAINPMYAEVVMATDYFNRPSTVVKYHPDGLASILVRADLWPMWTNRDRLCIRNAEKIRDEYLPFCRDSEEFYTKRGAALQLMREKIHFERPDEQDNFERHINSELLVCNSNI